LLPDVEVEHAEDAVAGLLARFVTGEAELVEGGLGGKMRELETAFDGTAVVGFQFQIRQAVRAFSRPEASCSGR
jgi:hypothetical protein